MNPPKTHLDAEGRSEFHGVPAEAVGLRVRIPGDKVSKRNAHLDWLYGGLVGRVDGDAGGPTLQMKRSQWCYNGEEGEAPQGESQPRDKPLRGAKLCSRRALAFQFPTPLPPSPLPLLDTPAITIKVRNLLPTPP